MRYLTLIRHAKSSWSHDVPDIERPLKKRGFNDANLMSKHLVNSSFKPDLILISPAKRAKQTAKIFIETLNWHSVQTNYLSDIYDFSGENTFQVITSCESQVKSLVLFGHNPTFSILASQLGSQFINNIPTCGLVQIEFKQDHWHKVKKGLTIKTLYPKALK